MTTISRLPILVLLTVLTGIAARPLLAQDAMGDYTHATARLRDASDRLLGEFRQRLQTPEGRPWDLPLRAAALGDDPGAHLAFVRDRIHLDAYPGMQRGAVGALASEAANPADKAMLLAELLRARAYEARVVRAKVTAEQAGALLAAALKAMRDLPSEALSPFGDGQHDPVSAAAIYQKLGLNANVMQRASDKHCFQINLLWCEALDLAWREAAFLAEQFGEPIIRARDLHEELLIEFATHYWVQFKVGDSSAWIDADPSMPGLALGQCVVAQGIEIVDAAKAVDLFRFELMLERSVGGNQESVSILDYEVPVCETLLRPIRFMILPDRGLEQLVACVGKEGEQQGKATREVVAKLRRFQAALLIGAETVGSKVFDREGRLFSVNANGALEGFSAPLGEAVRLFEGLLDRKAAPEIKPTGLRIVLSSTREGRLLWRRERMLAVAADRTTWLPIVHWELFLHNQRIRRPFAQALQRAMLVDSAGQIRALFGSETPSGKSGQSYPIELLKFARARQEFAAVQDRPLLVFEHADLLMATVNVSLGAQGVPLIEKGIDIVENGAIAVVAGERLAVHRLETTRLGVFDTVLEQVLLRAKHGDMPTVGVLGPFERARAMRSRFHVVSASDGNALRQSGLGADSVAWILGHSAKEERVLVASGVPNAWWTMDAATGRAIGRISGGRGGAAVCASGNEYLIMLKITLEATCVLKFLLKPLSNRKPSIASGVELALCAVAISAGIRGHEYVEAAALVIKTLADLAQELPE